MAKKTNQQFAEAELEKAIIELFQQQGYEYVPGENVAKPNETLILEDLRTFLRTRYAEENLSENELQQIIRTLVDIPSAPLYFGNRQAFWLVNQGFDLVRDDVNRVALHVDFIDFEKPENNIFKVVNQFSVQGEHLRRPDLLLFINGIPVVICEFKSAINEDTTIHDAWEQITIRYAHDIPNLLKYCFLSVISDGANTKLGSVFTPYEFYYAWNKVNDTDKAKNGINSLVTMIMGALSKERVLQILRDFIFYPDDSKKNEVIVCRYPQYFATIKMLENIKKHLRPHGDGKGGTYFGATGCGKTYTMLFLARMIAHRDPELFQNPTVIIIVDREDLDNQTTKLFVTAKKFLNEETNLRSIESREDLGTTLKNTKSGGVFICSIQKFCEGIGLLSERCNIICISDEAHRTQTSTKPKTQVTEKGVFTRYGFAKYLRDSFPNATYCGFTGTPIDETISVFGDIVNSYTMREACEDGITVRIAYEPRLARVTLSEEQAQLIQDYYDQCEVDGSNPEQIEKSKRMMAKMRTILGHPERIAQLAIDIVQHYERLCTEKPEIVQKAMIVCSDRMLAFKLLKEIIRIRPAWGDKRKCAQDCVVSKENLEKLKPLSKINLVATRGENDEKELSDCCGTKDYRKMLDEQFKNDDSNFQIAIVVDMWITGFDVPSLAVMYIDKPLQKHTLIQTISRVNRVFNGKEKGLIVDYIGIKNAMMEAVKLYGNVQENPVDELNQSLSVFRNHLALLNELMYGFDATKFDLGTPLERLFCLNFAAEHVQRSKDTETRFMRLTQLLKGAYVICFPSGELSDAETIKAQFYLAIRSIIYKQTKGDVPDAEIMNHRVEEMVKEAITCTGMEDILDKQKSFDLFSDEFWAQLDAVKLPITKFNALLKLLRKVIANYSHQNKVKSIEFKEKLQKVVDKYNNRDFTSGVIEDFVNELSDQLIIIYRELQEDKTSFSKFGITFEEKTFYDILVKVRHDREFEYSDAQCIALAKKVRELVADKIKFADWSERTDVKNMLQRDLTMLLYQNGYPPNWSNDVFQKVLEQTENYKKYEES